MPIQVIRYPNQYCFSGNPVVFELITSTNDNVDVEVTIDGKTESATYIPFKINENEWKVKFDLSDYLKFTSESQIVESDSIISELYGFTKIYQLNVNDGDYMFKGIAFSGGLSTHAIRMLDENNYLDLFSFRLDSAIDQFLFTTRTNGPEIRIKETELFPFVFIHPGQSIIFKNESGTEITTAPKQPGTICLMNIKQVLSKMPAGTRRIDVGFYGESSFHFLIESGLRSSERYLIRFRNSLGAFEAIEVTGRANHSPEFAEENLFDRISEFDWFESRRHRLQTRDIIEVETGYIHRKEISFVIDMIQSDETYFVYPDGETFRCNISAENLKYRQQMNEPVSFLLKIQKTAQEEFVTPGFDMSGIEDIGIFDETFDETFN